MNYIDFVIFKTLAVAYGEGVYGSDIVYGGAVDALSDTGSPYFIPLLIGIGLVLLGATLLAVKLIRRRKSTSSHQS